VTHTSNAGGAYAEHGVIATLQCPADDCRWLASLTICPTRGNISVEKHAHHIMFRPSRGGTKTHKQSYSTDITHLTARI